MLRLLTIQNKDSNHAAGAAPRERVERPASVMIDPARKNDFPPIIQLNVGGMMFSTTWETLTVRDPGKNFNITILISCIYEFMNRQLT